jgi:methylated-DNA-[protein]-cysteine S-methyltransferase
VHLASATSALNDAETIIQIDENTTIKGCVERQKYLVENEKASTHLTVAKAWFTAYFQAKEAPFPTLDFSELSGFSKEVSTQLLQCTRFGQTTTYGELARLVGRPQAVRAVGTVMRRNPWPLLIPCHRVLLSNGSIGKYSAGRGELTKRWLLKHESRYQAD